MTKLRRAAAFLLTITFATAARAAIPDAERQVLINLYDKTNGDNWTNKTGWRGAAGTECNWFGVTCSGDGTNVVFLTLSANGLAGPLPALSQLSSLGNVLVDRNQITGPIPDLPGKIVAFFAPGNKLSGPLPDLSQYSQLDNIFIGDNQLTGSLPRFTANLTIFDASRNHFTGPLPEFPAGSKLVNFSVDANGLVGEIPRSILNVTGFTTLLLGNNGLFSNDPVVRAFVDAHSPGWSASQTVPPTGVVARPDNRSTITVAWTPAPNAATATRYEVFSATALLQSLPYTKASATFGNLDATKSYDFRVRTVTDPSSANANRVEGTFSPTITLAPGPEVRPFDIGLPKLRSYWVDAVNGNDANDGSSRVSAFKTINAGLNAGYSNGNGIGFEVVLRAGDYSETPTLSARASYESPIILRAEVTDTARIHGFTAVTGSYAYLIGVSFSGITTGSAIIAGGDFLLLRDVHVIGSAINVNFSTHVYLENLRVEDATGNAIVIDRTQYGHLTGSRVARAAGACVSVGDGSAYLTIDSNDLGPCQSGGIQLGLGSSVSRLISPWIHYDSYDVKITNNVIHDYGSSALLFGGAYNLLFAQNTVVSSAASSFIRAITTSRTCSDPAACQSFRDAGGWGPLMGTAYIPNKNVSIFGNIFYARSADATNLVNASSAMTTQPGTNVPVPTRSDDNLQIRGNIVWASQFQLVSNLTSGCDNSNPTCNTAQLTNDNRINVIQPQFVDVANGNYRPRANGNLFGLPAVTIPPFTWSDAPSMPSAPSGEIVNTVVRDADGLPRSIFVPGAFTLSAPLLRHRAIAPH